MKWMLVVFVLAGMVRAEDCPVRIVGSSAGIGGMWCRQSYCVAITMVNNHDKKIVGAKFGVAFLDAVGDPHESVFNYTSDDGVNPAKKHTYVWPGARSEIESSKRGSNVWVEKLLFEDGSRWEEVGSRTCEWHTPVKN